MNFTALATYFERQAAEHPSFRVEYAAYHSIAAIVARAPLSVADLTRIVQIYNEADPGEHDGGFGWYALKLEIEALLREYHCAYQTTDRHRTLRLLPLESPLGSLSGTLELPSEEARTAWDRQVAQLLWRYEQDGGETRITYRGGGLDSEGTDRVLLRGKVSEAQLAELLRYLESQPGSYQLAGMGISRKG
ncbi:MAG: hypothetical protein AAFY76_01170 [Cyanobacteria bacterium J06649_11]